MQGLPPGHKTGSVDAAVLAVGELIDIYCAGNQPEMNMASYEYSILTHYKTVDAYYQMINRLGNNDKDVRLRNLYYREFCEWFDLNHAANVILNDYTYAAAEYSALPMETNGLFKRWSPEELDIEYNIYRASQWSPVSFKSDAEQVSAEEFDKLVTYFKKRTHQDIIE